jgi:hypothetical protein
MSDPRRPLWASGLADEPRSGYDDVVVRVLEEEPEEAPPQPQREEPAPDRKRRSLVPALLGVLAFVAVVIALEGRGPLTIADVPSYWGDVPMTCDTIRVEDGDRAIEYFQCRALGGRRLPPGLYSSPESQWRSDLTRQAADQSRIRISRDGEVVGWARY